MTFWSDDRSHVLEDGITYVWLILVGLVIGVPSMEFLFLILCFRLLGSVSHANTRVGYGWLGEHILVSPQFHRTHHALKAAGRRSCNFGTTLSLWDIVWDRQVPRQHGRDWRCRSRSGSSQRFLGGTAGCRLSPHGPLSPARKEGAGYEVGMIAAITQHWMGRVLDQGRLGIRLNECWKLEAYEQYKSRLRAAEYPCFFGQSGEARGEMLYTFVAKGGLAEFVTNMREFVSLIGAPPHERSSMVAFLEPDLSMTNHESFLARFWEVLQFLHEHDRSPFTERTPDHPLWEFAFEGCEMFVVGASPTYQRRRSRNLGPGVVIVFQPRSLFD